MKMKKMILHGVNLDVMTNQPVVILKDSAANYYLPIWIGQFEATSILMELQGIKPARPLTHDLMRSMLEKMDSTLDKVVINDIKDGTFYAKLFLRFGSVPMEIDARPSDAIALAVRTKASIFVADSVIDEASIVSEQGEEEEVKRFRSFLSEINPEDFKL